MSDLRSEPPQVSVVVPYYDDQHHLTLLLRALDQQVGGVRFEVIVADDGSPQTPTAATGLGFSCTIVRQADRGFRAAAARNLGAAAARGELLMFLDGDTLPTTGYLAAMLETAHQVDTSRGVLVVGHRRHLDLHGLPDERVLAGLAGINTDSVAVLQDPPWLADGYARTDDLRNSSDEDFRLVISAVLAVDRRLWNAVGGFDESFVGYGGEDWDFAWRAWLSGADRRYEPDAVAWHDGPDAGGRGPDPVGKNVETLRLAGAIPLSSTRGSVLRHEIPQITVRYHGPVTGTAADAAVVVTVAALLADSDAAVWFPGCRTARELPPGLAQDSRVHVGDVPRTVLDRSPLRCEVWTPLSLTVPLAQLCAGPEFSVDGVIEIRRTRSAARGSVVSARTEHPAVQQVSAEVSLERWWGGW